MAAKTIGIFLLLLTSLAQSPEPQSIYRSAVLSVMTLEVEKTDGTRITGSAFMISDSGVAATAWHVVNGARNAIVRFSDGQEFEVSGLIDKDENRDLALVKVKVFGKPLLKMVGVDPEVGSRAYVIGAPRGLAFSITEGLVSQIQNIGGIKQYQFSSPASPGNSGGPLLNSKGEAIGVASWQVRDGQNLNFAIPSSYLLGLDASLPTTPWIAVKPLNKVSVDNLTDEESDEVLAKGFWALLESGESISAQIVIELQSGGYKSGIDPWLYTTQRNLGSVTEQLQQASMEPKRENFKNDLLASIKIMQEAMTYLFDAVRLAQQTRWTPQANDLLKRGNAAYVSADGAMKKLQEAPVWKAASFQSNLPDASREPVLSVALGITVYSSRPYLISGVVPRSLAEKLGLKPLDGLPMPPKLLELDLAKWKGKRMQFGVNRMGKQVTIKGQIPKTFLEGSNQTK